LVRTYTATDLCGNEASDTQTITVVDTTAPTLTVGPDVTVECDEPVPGSSYTADDNCGDVNVTVSEEVTPGDCPQEYTLTRTYTAEDECGNTTSDTQVINVVDTTAPLFVNVPGNLAVECIDDVPAPANVQATDNCGDVTITLVENMPTDFCGEGLRRTWTATDECGNTTTVMQDIFINDTTAPTITAGPDATVECDEDIPAPSYDADDNCAEPSVEVVEVITPGDCPQEFTITRTYTATDDCDNSASDVQVINVVDTTAPELTNPPVDVTVECDEPMPTYTPIWEDNCGTMILTDDMTTVSDGCEIEYTTTYTATDECGNTSTATWVLTVTDTTAPTITAGPDASIDCDEDVPAPSYDAADNCGDPTVTVNEVITPGDCPQEYTVVRTYTAVDACGNSASDTQTINVSDTEAPIAANTPVDITIDCDENFPSFDPEWSDNCGTVNATVVVDNNGGDCQSGIVETYTATDECGNTSTLTRTITIVDLTAPTITAAADVTIECDEAVPAPDYTAADNCVDPIVEVTEVITPGDCPQEFTITRTYTATDLCGNTAEDVQVITVQDTTAPVVANEPVDVTIECDEAIPAYIPDWTDNCGEVTETAASSTMIDDCTEIQTMTWTATDECGNSTTVSRTVTIVDTTAPTIVAGPDATVECDESLPIPSYNANDNCGDPSVEITTEMTPGDCPQEYTLVRTYTATDECGNTASDTQTITVVDTTAPVLANPPSDITVECDEVIPSYDPIWSDNCGTITETANTTTTVDGCIEIQETIWTAIDECGNASTTSRTVTIVDTTAPTITAGPDASIECDEDVPAPSHVADDNCSTPVVTVTEEVIPGDCPNEYTLIRTYTATDACGNEASDTQTINVSDTTAPVIMIDTQIAASCDDIPEPSDIDAMDNCSATEDIVWELMDETFSGGCPGTIVREYMATDECGNSTIANQIITLFDNVDPVLIGVPADMTVDCQQVPAPAVVTATDNCDANPEVTFEEVIGMGCPYTITRTWTAEDECNNIVTATQVITVDDTTAPAITCPADVTLPCNGTVPAADIDDVIVTDNCTSVEVTHVGDVTSTDDCLVTVTRTYMAEDECGNTSTCEQVFTIPTDQVAPTLDGPADITLECNADLPAPDVAEVDADDNCQLSSVTHVGDVTVSVGCNEVTTRTYQATDLCGNNATYSYVITIPTDNDAPVITCPDNLVLDCTESTDPSNTGMATATDACGSVVVDFSDSIDASECPIVITRTWTATDPCGNASECVQIIQVNDEVAPVFDPFMLNITAMCDDIPGVESVVATDNCDSDVEITLMEELFSGGCPGTLFRTYMAIDDCGNETVATQVIVLFDDTDPVLVGVPADLTTDPDNIPAPATVDAVDNCDIDMSVEFTEQIIGDPQSGLPYSIIRTWTAEDNCANSATDNQVITVIPAPSPMPDEYYTVYSMTDLPGMPDMSSYSGCDGEGYDMTYTETLEFNNCGAEMVRDFIYTDNCDHVLTMSQYITIITMEDPDQLESIIASNGVELTWEPVPGTIACQIKGGLEDGSDPVTITVTGNEPSYKFIPMSQLQQGTSYQWKVRCACELSPVTVSDFSDYDVFTFDVSGLAEIEEDTKAISASNFEMTVYPNPNDGNFIIETDMKDYTVEIRDISGKIIWSKADNNENQVVIESLDVETGMYTIRLFNSTAVITDRVIIKD